MPLNRNIPPIGDRTIDDFKSRLVQGGARPNLFEVEFNFPTAIGEQLSVSTVEEDLKFRMMIKGAQLPASNIAEVVVPFRGRQLKVAGDRRFDPWTITILNDGDFNIRDAFEKWSNFIIKVSDGSGTINPADYQAEWTVHQLGRGAGDLMTPGEQNTNQLPVLRSYRMRGCWPSAISGIELSYDSADTIEEFQVTMQVQYWEAFDKDPQDAIV